MGRKATKGGAAGLQCPLPLNRNFKKKKRVVRYRSNILYNLPFSQNQPLELAAA